MTTLRDLRLRDGLDLATVAQRMGVSEAAARAIEAQRLDGTSVAALRLYAEGLGARLELVHADGRREVL